MLDDRAPATSAADPDPGAGQEPARSSTVQDSPRFRARQERGATPAPRPRDWRELLSRRPGRRLVVRLVAALTACCIWAGAALHGDGIARRSGQLAVTGVAVVVYVMAICGALVGLGYLGVTAHRLLRGPAGRLLAVVHLGRRPVDAARLHPFEPAVLRTPAVRQVRVVAGLCLLSLAFALRQIPALLADSDDFLPFLGLVILFVAPFILCWAIAVGWRCRLVIDRTGVRSIEPFSSRHVPWSAIEEVTIDSAGHPEADPPHHVVISTADRDLTIDVPSGRTAAEVEGLRDLLLRGRDLARRTAAPLQDGIPLDATLAPVTATGAAGLAQRLPPWVGRWAAGLGYTVCVGGTFGPPLVLLVNHAAGGWFTTHLPFWTALVEASRGWLDHA